MKNFTSVVRICAGIFIILVVTFSCNSVEPPNNDKPQITLNLEDASCTEAWIQLTPSNLQLPVTLTLKQNDVTRKTINLTKPDTLLYLDSLLPNQTYNLSVEISGIQYPESGIQFTTMDTTSHNFTFETFTFGEHSSSTLYDVAIIDENNIWAVGEIYMNDSLGQPDSQPYAVAHWNGTEWIFMKVPYHDFNQTVKYPGPLFTVADIESNIYVASYANLLKWTGNDWEEKAFFMEQIPFDGQVQKVWGINENNIYCVGRNGAIYFYFGSDWQKVESKTTVGLSDIYGDVNGDIYTCGGNLSTGQGIVLKINSNNTVTKVIDSYYYGSGFDSTKMFTENLYGPLVGIWVAKNGSMYTVGNLIYRYNLGRWDYAEGIEYNYLGAGGFTGRGFAWEIAGLENNDLIFVGERNTLRYFNGIRAVQIGEPFSYTSEYQWYSVDYKKSTAVTVGKKGGYAAVIIFKR